MELPFDISDISLFCACFGLNADDLADYLFKDKEVYSYKKIAPKMGLFRLQVFSSFPF